MNEIELCKEVRRRYGDDFLFHFNDNESKARLLEFLNQRDDGLLKELFRKMAQA
ncbi:MAG: hypothetical protein IKO14_05840 [Oscillibacter sp.]|nr:hypothetical protein [Oscillibacter sp.]